MNNKPETPASKNKLLRKKIYKPIKLSDETLKIIICAGIGLVLAVSFCFVIASTRQAPSKQDQEILISSSTSYSEQTLSQENIITSTTNTTEITTMLETSIEVTTEQITEAVTTEAVTEGSPENLFWEKCWQEYPKATEIWLLMDSFGWSDAAKAGVLGNIMREAGGNSLAHIDETVFNYNRTHFGLCQWSKQYYPDIQPTRDWMPSIKEQIEFLRHTLMFYSHHGYNYGFTEEYLLTATDPQEVAEVFCQGYERPNESPALRKELAQLAYDFFTQAY